MNLLELKEQVDLLIKYTRHPEDKTVVIELSQSSIGPVASVGIRNIYQGFDHDNNRIIINPNRAICDKSIFESRNRIGRLAYTRESSDGKLLHFCPECFTKISKKDSYCRDCGTKICHEVQL